MHLRSQLCDTVPFRCARDEGGRRNRVVCAGEKKPMDTRDIAYMRSRNTFLTRSDPRGNKQTLTCEVRASLLERLSTRDYLHVPTLIYTDLHDVRRRRRRIYYTDVVPQLELPVYYVRHHNLCRLKSYASYTEHTYYQEGGGKSRYANDIPGLARTRAGRFTGY